MQTMRKISTDHKLTEGRSLPRCFATSSDLTTIAFGDPDGTLRLFDGTTGAKTLDVTVGDAEKGVTPTAIAISADAKAIYVLQRRKQGVIAFDTKTATPIRTLAIPTAENDFARDPYSQSLVFSQKDQLLAVMQPDRAILWDTALQKKRMAFEAPGGPFIIKNGAFTRDGGSFAFYHGQEIILFDAVGGNEKKRLFTPTACSALVGCFRMVKLWPPAFRPARLHNDLRSGIWETITGFPGTPRL